MIIRLFVFLTLLTISDVLGHSFGPVKKGKLDLRKWNSLEYSTLLLDGEWEFYWKRLILSKDIKAGDEPAYAQLSTPWSEQLINGKQYPKDGYATYALEVWLPHNTKSISFVVPAVFNSYAFWVNDKLICRSGKVATNQKEMIPMWKPQTVSINNPTDKISIIFQISNFQQTRGGCAEHMRIGNTEYLTHLNSTFHVSGLALIILFAFVGASGLAISFINRRKSFLCLALLALAYSLRFLFSDLYFYYDIGINLNWQTASKIEYFTIPLIMLCASLFISTIYPQEFKPIVLKGFVVVNVMLMIVVVFVPSSIFTPLLVVIQIAGLVLATVTIYTIVRALIFKRVGAWISGLGIAVFAFVGFYNIYAFIAGADLDRIIIHSGYVLALLLNIISLLYRTPLRLEAEEQDILRYADLYDENIKI